MQKKESAELYKKFTGLLKESKSLILGTVDQQGAPRVSYAPYVSDESGGFYIYISKLSAHTNELIDHPAASVLLIEDESRAGQIFARMRVTYQCRAVVVEPDHPEYEKIIRRFARTFGSIVDLLSTLPDFVLFRLLPHSGRFVTGFGQAYDLTGEHLDQFAHVGPEQIQRS